MSSSTARPTTSSDPRRRQPSRLQRRAPASLQIGPTPSWNVAIPLLSPLAGSPPPAAATRPEDRVEEEQSRAGAEAEKKSASVTFKKWQHPAAPFCYEPGPFVAPFIPV